MSTIVVAKKGGEAVIGADTLTCLGSTKESAAYIENHSKITKIGTSYIAHVGHASWGLVLARCFAKLKREPRLDSPQQIFETARELHQLLKLEYYLNPKEDDEDPFESSQVDCLIANPSGIYGLYSLRSVQQYSRFYAFGSGYKFALGAMRAVYETAASAKEVAQAGLDASVDFDDGMAPPLEIISVPLAG